MRTIVLRFVTLAGLLVTAGGCTDSPTGTVPDASAIVASHDEIQGCVTGGLCVLEPIGSDPGTGCDPTITECDDGGWDSCMSSAPGTPNPESSTINCAGGGGSGAGGDGGTGGGDGEGDERVCPDYGCEKTAFEEGPLAWGACVLAVLGTTYTVGQVAGAFEDWWVAQREYESVRRTYVAVTSNPESVSPETIDLWTFRLKYAGDRRDAAMASVSEKTGATYWALAAAAVGCGVAAFLPTP